MLDTRQRHHTAQPRRPWRSRWTGTASPSPWAGAPGHQQSEPGRGESRHRGVCTPRSSVWPEWARNLDSNPGPLWSSLRLSHERVPLSHSQRNLALHSPHHQLRGRVESTPHILVRILEKMVCHLTSCQAMSILHFAAVLMFELPAPGSLGSSQHQCPSRPSPGLTHITINRMVCTQKGRMKFSYSTGFCATCPLTDQDTPRPGAGASLALTMSHKGGGLPQ